MRLDGLILNDEFLERLLGELKAPPELLSDPDTGREAVGNLVLYALEALAAALEAGQDTPVVDRRRLEGALAELAGRTRVLEMERDERGVPLALWTDATAWRALDEAPGPALEAEELADRLAEYLDLHPSLRVVISNRLLATNEKVSGALAQRPENDLAVIVRMRGKRYRLRFRGPSTLVRGILVEDPELLPDESSALRPLEAR
jgi:hypothetical protein